MVVLRTGVTEKGTREYYLVGLDHYEDFDIVLDQFSHLDVDVMDTLDGIYSRIARIKCEEFIFKIIYHEDVGVYSFVVGESSSHSNMQLEQLLEKVVKSINVL